MAFRGLRIFVAAAALIGVVASSACVPIAAGAVVGTAAAHGTNKNVSKGAAVGGLAGAAVAL